MPAFRQAKVTPTDQILKALGKPEELEPSDSRYRCFNTGGVEIEVGEFLYGLVRMLKPAEILETGTHKGISAAYMGLALKENGEGHLTTIEFLEPNWAESTALLHTLGLSGLLNIVLMDAANYKTDLIFDILFLDTEPQTRFAEFVKFYPNVKPGGLIMIHDLHPHMHQMEVADHEFGWPYGKLPEEMRRLIHDGKIRLVHFRTPRGLTMFYKVAPDDYTPTTTK